MVDTVHDMIRADIARRVIFGLSVHEYGLYAETMRTRDIVDEGIANKYCFVGGTVFVCEYEAVKIRMRLIFSDKL